MFNRLSFAKKHFVKAYCGSIEPGEFFIPINSKMNHVANKLISKIYMFRMSSVSLLHLFHYVSQFHYFGTAVIISLFST